MNNCGISRWDDPNEINARLKALTSQPIWEVTDEYYNNVILKYFDEKCKASKAVYEESKEYIPGGVQHNLAFNKPFPMCMAKAEGAYLYDKDGNKTKKFNEERDAVFLGKKRYAPWTGGLGTNFRYKNVSLIADFAWVAGTYMLVNDAYFIANAQLATKWNQRVEMLNVWTTPGQITNIQSVNYAKQFTDQMIQNASFLRMKTLSIQYEFPKKWMQATRYIKGVKVFGIARNLFTITPFEGYDPEPDQNLVQFNYPNTRQFVFGAEISF